MNNISDICNKCKKNDCFNREKIVFDYKKRKIIHSLCCLQKELQKSDLNEKQQKRLDYFINDSDKEVLSLKENIITEPKYFIDIIKKEFDRHDFQIEQKCPFYAELCMIIFNQGVKNEN